MILLVVFLVSLIPLVSLLLWLMGRRKGDAEYKKLCRRALGRGMLCRVLLSLENKDFIFMNSFVSINF